jgi:hypothetical protein
MDADKLGWREWSVFMGLVAGSCELNLEIDYEINLEISQLDLFWQGCYWYFIIIARRQKIEKMGRITSFTWLVFYPI